MIRSARTHSTASLRSPAYRPQPRYSDLALARLSPSVGPAAAVVSAGASSSRPRLRTFSSRIQAHSQSSSSLIYRTYRTSCRHTLSSQPLFTMSRRVASTSSGSPHKHDDGHGDHGHTHPQAATQVKKHKHAGGDCDHDHDHGGLFHTHAHDHSEGAEQIMKAWSAGKLDRGTRITLLGTLFTLTFSDLLDHPRCIILPD